MTVLVGFLAQNYRNGANRTSGNPKDLTSTVPPGGHEEGVTSTERDREEICRYVETWTAFSSCCIYLFHSGHQMFED